MPACPLQGCLARPRLPSLLSLALGLASTWAPCGERVPVSRFGLRPGASAPGPALRRIEAYLAAHPGTTLVFPKGKFRFTPAEATSAELHFSNTDPAPLRRVALLLKGLRGVRIEGRQTRFTFEGRMLPLALVDCEDVEIRGFRFDWSRPLLSQATVVAADGGGVTLRIDASRYPHTLEQGRLLFTGPDGLKAATWEYMEFDPRTRNVAAETGDVECLGRGWETHVAEVAGPGQVRLKATFRRLPRVGNVLVARHGIRDHAGTYLEGCRNVRLEDLVYHHTSGLGLLAQYSQDISVRDVHFVPSKGRLFSGHDDGFHFSNCKGSVSLDRCSTRGLLDDGFNVHASLVQVVERLGARTLRCRFPHFQSVDLRFADPGDQIVGVDGPSMAHLGSARFRSLTRIRPDLFEATFEEDLPERFAPGILLENRTWTPSVQIRGCTFGEGRARGVLVSTPHPVLIEDSTFRTSGCAILLAGDTSDYFEASPCREVTIRRNRFENCVSSPYMFNGAVVVVQPTMRQPLWPPYNANVRILDNTFITFDRPILWARSVEGLTFRGNRIQASRAFAPWHTNPFGLTFLDCEQVDVDSNHLDPTFRGRGVRIDGGRAESIRVRGWEQP